MTGQIRVIQPYGSGPSPRWIETSFWRRSRVSGPTSPLQPGTRDRHTPAPRRCQDRRGSGQGRPLHRVPIPTSHARKTPAPISREATRCCPRLRTQSVPRDERAVREPMEPRPALCAPTPSRNSDGLLPGSAVNSRVHTISLPQEQQPRPPSTSRRTAPTTACRARL